MRIIIAPDKFKDSLTAAEAAACMARGAARVYPQAELIPVPLSDGGEGLVPTLVEAAGGEMRFDTVTGPLGTPVRAGWGIMPDGRTAVIESAAASGLSLIPENRRNPLAASTDGTGELIRHALECGCPRLIIGIGGSATNDGGAGMARALGVRFIDQNGRDLPPGGAALLRLEHVDTTGLDPRLKKTAIRVACDVNNLLTGPRGASVIYGPQKGASKPMIDTLDRALRHYAQVLRRDLGVEVENVPGSGAAGGLGAGLIAFLGAQLIPGIDLVLDALEIEKDLARADLLLTGEGKLDAQSACGKAPIGAARMAKKYGVPVILFAGSVPQNTAEFHREGITACFSISPGPLASKESMSRAKDLLEWKTAEVLGLWKTASEKCRS